MTPDPKQTLSATESDQPNVMRDTVVQPMQTGRHHDLARTRYWEQRSGDTRVSVAPNDAIAQAVAAAREQLKRAGARRDSHEGDKAGRPEQTRGFRG
jgi:hypothetical protein